MIRDALGCLALATFALVAGSLAGCSDDAPAKRDAAVDVGSGSADAGLCGSDEAFVGELVDWDSIGEGDSFCGVFMATFAVHGDSTRTDSTPPNGRVELCVAPAATTQIDITPPTGSSPCLSAPGTYTLPAIAIANQAAIATGHPFSFRMFTSARATSFFAGFSPAATIDPTKAQLFVSITGNQRAASITAASLAPQAFDGTAWAAGSTGVDVFFPNVTVPAGGTDTLTIAGGAIGAGSVPLVAGTFTYVTVDAN